MGKNEGVHTTDSSRVRVLVCLTWYLFCLEALLWRPCSGSILRKVSLAASGWLCDISSLQLQEWPILWAEILGGCLMGPGQACDHYWTKECTALIGQIYTTCLFMELEIEWAQPNPLRQEAKQDNLLKGKKKLFFLFFGVFCFCFCKRRKNGCWVFHKNRSTSALKF